MTAPILVTGGTGNIGSHVVARLRQHHRDVRILSRHPRPDSPGVRHVEGDVMTGAGVAAALDGVDVVLHLAGGPKGDDVATRELVSRAEKCGVSHLIFISVIGAGRMPIGYFRMKAAAESAITESAVPWTVLRAAQLHDFAVPVVRALSRLPIVPVPRDVRFEPVDVDVVAARLVQLALEEPAGRVADIAGPEVIGIPELITAYNESQGRRRRMLRFGLPGAVGRAYRDGANLGSGDVVRAGGTWRDYLNSYSEQERRLG